MLVNYSRKKSQNYRFYILWFISVHSQIVKNIIGCIIVASTLRKHAGHIGAATHDFHGQFVRVFGGRSLHLTEGREEYMVDYRDSGHPIGFVEEEVTAFVNQEFNESLGDVVIDQISPIFPVCHYLLSDV